ncbi:MAG TPA: CheR family methyltransferase [Gemmataceae bacterium]|nr:CheR family methyltransferase [Gemmataceae bacterium]
MTDQDFAFICKLVQQRSAIVLEDGKQYLVESRLTPIVRGMNLGSIKELVERLRADPSNGLHTQIVEAMTTNETSFFRDHQPFEALRMAVLPDLIRRRSEERRLNIWCAACSSGQEPYSIALQVRTYFPELASWKISLLGSDLSRDVLARAREGRYNQIEVNRGLPAALLVKHFRQYGTDWQLESNIRRLVEFQEINLSQPWPPLPRMDLVLLRNVLIYFDVATKKTILGKLARLLRPDGYLLLGGAETTFNLEDSFRRVEHLKSGFYQLLE